MRVPALAGSVDPSESPQGEVLLLRELAVRHTQLEQSLRAGRTSLCICDGEWFHRDLKRPAGPLGRQAFARPGSRRTGRMLR